jgi:hypothetical protein
LLDAPLVHRFNLGGRNVTVHLGIAPLLTKVLALQELPSSRLARLRPTEEDREPQMLGRIIGGAEDPLCYLGQRRHSLAAARTGAHQDLSRNPSQPPNSRQATEQVRNVARTNFPVQSNVAA